MKIAVTGHRPDKLGNEYDLKGPYSEHIRKQLQQAIDDLSPSVMLSGMALGVDTIWALLARENKIPLMAIVPFPSQPKIWPYSSKQLYHELLEYARATGGVIVVGTDPYEAWKMEIRNEYMVNNCDLLVAVYNGDQRGGTYNCLKYAESTKVGKPILRINPNPYNENISKGDEGNIDDEHELWLTIRRESERSG